MSPSPSSRGRLPAGGGWLPRAPGVAACLALGGCEGAPSITLLGAYFPAWMLCVAIGVVVTLVARWVFVAAGIDASLGPRGVVYPALALGAALAAWLLFFRG